MPDRQAIAPDAIPLQRGGSRAPTRRFPKDPNPRQEGP